MAIDTDNKKYSLITMEQPWNTPIPHPVGALTVYDQMHLIWEYCGLDWTGLLSYFFFGVAEGEYIPITGTANQIAVAYNDADITLSFANPTYFGSAANILAGNYSEFEADGTIVLHGDATVHDDWYFEIAPKTTGVGKPTLANFSGNVNQWQMAINDISELRPVELAHKWKEATEIEIHVHWGTNGVDGTNRGVKWEIDYSWANPLSVGATTAFAGVTTDSAETQIPAATPDKTHMYTTVITVTPAGGKIGAVLVMSLKRIASVTDPTPTSDPWVFMVGIHYMIDTVGSRTRTAK